MNAHHALVWLDHSEARIFRFTGEEVEHLDLHAKKTHNERHEQGRGHVETHYFEHVVKGLGEAERVLVVGPSTAKLDFIRYLHKHAHAVEAKVVGVETVDHPTDGQLVAYAKHYFHASDRMTG